MITKVIYIVVDIWSDKHTIGADHLLELFYNSGKKGKIEFCPIFDDFRNDVITTLVDINFLYFYNQQKYMSIGLNLIYNFDLSRQNQNFSRGYKLLHVF